jgi:hypothetical protein
MGDGAEQALEVDVVARHRHVGEAGGFGNQPGVLQADRNGRADLVVALVHHLLAVDLVGRRRKEAFDHHVLEDLGLDVVLPHEREALRHRHHRAPEDRVVGQLDRRRRLRLGPGAEDALANQLQERLTALDGVLAPGHDDAELPGGGEVGPAEHRRGHEHLTGGGVRLLETADRPDAVGAHRQMNRPRGERGGEAVGTQGDVEHGRILDEHGDDHVGRAPGLGHRGRRGGACGGKGLHLRRVDVEHGHGVAAAHHAPRHARSHPAEADEAHVHVVHLSTPKHQPPRAKHAPTPKLSTQTFNPQAFAQTCNSQHVTHGTQSKRGTREV